MKYLRKPTASAGDDGGGGSIWMDPDFLSAFPALGEFMSDTRWEDGSPRETGTLLFFVEGGDVKACLMDRASSRRVFVTATTFRGLLELLEMGLRDDRLDWRKDQVQPRKKGGR